jgi:glycolate oxidase
MLLALLYKRYPYKIPNTLITMELSPYEYDASQIKGKAKGIFFPLSVGQAKAIIVNNPKITIRGGGTGLSGGAVPNNDIILDTSKLTKIGKLDKERKTIEVESGVILDDLNKFLEDYDLEFPINPSSHAACTIGGMIATDAVGSRAIKYGSTSKQVRWIEIIDAQGNLKRKGATEISDYANMEGITGIIMRACLNLAPKKERTASLIPVEDLDELISLTHRLKNHKGISMIEMLDEFTAKGIGLEEKYHIIAEFEDNTGKLKEEKYAELLKLRDKLYPFLAREGYTKIEDPKLHPNKIKDFLTWLKLKKIPSFGHISVGIIHPCFKPEQEKLIPQMMKIVKKLSGQVSGEHGIGILKKKYLDPQDKKILENVKKRTDPTNKFNQGKII